MTTETLPLTYPHYVAWKVNLEGIKDPYQLFHKTDQKRIEKSFRKIQMTPLEFRCEKINNEFLSAFIPIYENNIRRKKHAIIFDIAKHLQERSKVHPYQSISLYDGEKLLGGQIFSVRENSLNIAFRIFPKENEWKLPTSLSFMAEYHFYKYALKHGKKEIVHGKDRNPYGQNSDIGLAVYKLSIGVRPYVSESEKNGFQQEWKKTNDENALIFLGERNGEEIKQAVLVLKKDVRTSQKKYEELFHYPFLKVSSLA